MGEFVRIDRTHFSAGHSITLTTGDAFKDAIGIGCSCDGRKSLPAAWRDLARNSGRSVTDLKALERHPAYLRVRR